MAELPTGTNPANPPPLPGGDLVGNPTLPGSTPTPPATVPEFWSDRARIVALILELYERDPAEAKRIGDFVRAKL